MVAVFRNDLWHSNPRGNFDQSFPSLIRPTTLAGVAELLRYAVEANIDGEGWPPELLADDGKTTRPWQHFLIESVAVALPKCA